MTFPFEFGMNPIRGTRTLWRMSAIAGLAALTGVGCAARLGRDYGHVLFPPADHVLIQRVAPTGEDGAPFPVETLLLVSPVGVSLNSWGEEMALMIWQESQQLLPGRVQLLRPGGRHAAYAKTDSLLADDGRVVEAEVYRIGQLTGASHILMPRVMDYRPYHPQRIVMEWVVFDVNRRVIPVILVGDMDASEQRVLIRADAYLRERKARPYTSGNLDLLLRSPREYGSFVVAQMVAALNGVLAPEDDPVFKETAKKVD